jgi:hypothetical protein
VQGPPRFNAGRPDSFKPRHLHLTARKIRDSLATFLESRRGHPAIRVCSNRPRRPTRLVLSSVAQFPGPAQDYRCARGAGSKRETGISLTVAQVAGPACCPVGGAGTALLDRASPDVRRRGRRRFRKNKPTRHYGANATGGG